MNTLFHIALLAARIVVAGIGLLLAYIALFMYEDSAKKWQNRLVELWVKIDDLKNRALSREIVFLLESLRLVNLGFDALLGVEYLSPRAIMTVLCFSLSSLAFVASGFTQLHFVKYGGHGWYPQAIRGMVFGMILFIMGVVGGLRLWIRIAAIVIIGLLNVHLLNVNLFTLWTGYVIFIGSVVLGICCDVLFVLMNRSIGKTSSGMERLPQILLMILLNIILGILYVAPLTWLDSSREAVAIQSILALIATTNIFTSLSAFAIVIVMIVAIVHRILWPIIQRPIYAIEKHEIFRKPTILLPASVMLLTWAIPAWKPFWELIGN